MCGCASENPCEDIGKSYGVPRASTSSSSFLLLSRSLQQQQAHSSHKTSNAEERRESGSLSGQRHYVFPRKHGETDSLDASLGRRVTGGTNEQRLDSPSSGPILCAAAHASRSGKDWVVIWCVSQIPRRAVLFGIISVGSKAHLSFLCAEAGAQKRCATRRCDGTICTRP